MNRRDFLLLVISRLFYGKISNLDIVTQYLLKSGKKKNSGIFKRIYLNGWEYNLLLSNEESYIKISIKPKGGKSKEYINLEDKGLDAICDFGMMPEIINWSPLEGLVNKEKKRIIYNQEKNEGLEHKEKFQKIYTRILEDLASRIIKYS